MAIYSCLQDCLSNPTNIVLLVLVCIIIYGVLSLRIPSGFPSGPRGYPFIGNMLALAKEPHITLTNYAKTYGDVYTIKLGNTPVVILNSIEVIKETLVKKQNDYAGRPNVYSFEMLSEGGEDIVMADFTPKWKVLRKFVHQAMRNYANGEKLESLIRDVSFPRLQQAINEKNGQPFHPKPAILLMIANIMATMCFGQRYELNDKEFLGYLKFINDLNEAFGNGLVADFIPFFRYIPTTGRTKVEALYKAYLQTIQCKIDEHKLKFENGNREARDLIDDLLIAQEKALKAGEADAALIGDVNLRQTVADVFGAGLDTTVTTLDWCVAYLCCYPDVQTKVQTEIDQAIGHDRLPLLSDKAILPYCEAVIHEVTRIRTVAPFAVPHTTTIDTSVGEYKLPKYTWVWMNLWNVHMNEKHWKKPEEFRPERFLDADGNLVPKPENVLPFSTGRRVCVGEALAKNEMFLIFVSLFQNYTFKVPPGKDKPCLKDHCEGLAIRCCPYNVLAVSR
ncbi:cytochrome P450 1A5-like [Saccoglossus kowalevskii]|uniref:Cytochrome P450 1A5-like n=1 Tax=Saccoglossus kowalevskii TaxID=10224 RepID=A0ABM0GTP3_SACKO|nr:PREDICTED: cytochrome P450 1A5-like [Saccoglossus kowalevskii]